MYWQSRSLHRTKSLPLAPRVRRRCRAIVTVSLITLHENDFEGIRVMGRAPPSGHEPTGGARRSSRPQALQVLRELIGPHVLVGPPCEGQTVTRFDVALPRQDQPSLVRVGQRRPVGSGHLGRHQHRTRILLALGLHRVVVLLGLFLGTAAVLRRHTGRTAWRESKTSLVRRPPAAAQFPRGIERQIASYSRAPRASACLRESGGSPPPHSTPRRGHRELRATNAPAIHPCPPLPTNVRARPGRRPVVDAQWQVASDAQMRWFCRAADSCRGSGALAKEDAGEVRPYVFG